MGYDKKTDLEGQLGPILRGQRLVLRLFSSCEWMGSQPDPLKPENRLFCIDPGNQVNRQMQESKSLSAWSRLQQTQLRMSRHFAPVQHFIPFAITTR
jgi:hypothetical protein